MSASGLISHKRDINTQPLLELLHVPPLESRLPPRLRKDALSLGLDTPRAHGLHPVALELPRAAGDTGQRVRSLGAGGRIARDGIGVHDGCAERTGQGRKSVWSSRTQQGGATTEGRVTRGAGGQEESPGRPGNGGGIVRSCSFPSPRRVVSKGASRIRSERL
jgi:hypothetical protein